MWFPEFRAMKAPSIACWALMLLIAYGGINTSNFWLYLLALLLLLAGIYFYNIESKKLEEKERKDKEEREKESKDKEAKEVLTGIFKFGSKYLPKP